VSGPLEGIKVLDLTRVLSGPYCTLMLADMGADVIKVERPGKGDDTRAWGPPWVEREGAERQSGYFVGINRNKRSIELDLKAERDREILWKLIDHCDVLVENFSPGTIGRLGFDFDEVHKRNPKMVYCSISGFGQTGPAAHRPAYDLVIQGMSGMMSITGPPNQPTKLGVPIADLASGMFGAYAIVTALFHQQRTGKGQYIDTSMLGGQMALLTFQAAIYFETGQQPPSTWNAHPIVAPYQTFPTADGHINIAVGNDVQWAKLCSELGLEELRDDPRFVNNEGRITNLADLAPLITEACANWTTGDLVTKLDAAGIPCGPIYTLPEAYADPQAIHTGMQLTQNHPTLGEVATTGFPYKLSETNPEIRLPAPLLGQHTEEILKEIGFEE
jgi:crotonobetainyl-CoA:carnitine CoA-transferase CaiB-like acyl-CoA transferase